MECAFGIVGKWLAAFRRIHPSTVIPFILIYLTLLVAENDASGD